MQESKWDIAKYVEKVFKILRDYQLNFRITNYKSSVKINLNKLMTRKVEKVYVKKGVKVFSVDCFQAIKEQMIPSPLKVLLIIRTL